MTDEQIALARRAVACRGWRWMPGMATYTPVPYTSPHLGRILSGENDILHLWRDETIPRLRDPATLGCLLALVREAWGDLGIFVRPRGSKMRPDWAVFTGEHSDIIAVGADEAEAIVVALEAAP